ncbi:MAG: hypothetical protein RQ798_01075 [Candidatus Caldarchaeales archaeon]|nr:hypothetical protein [Candidatus Caldarchaeales archaeon]MDT7915107.1 hypothetical protein [Candidatus Caldarchaeales archaeon]
MYWLLVVKDHVAGWRQIAPAMQVLATRVKRGFWLVSQRIHQRGESKRGIKASSTYRVERAGCWLVSAQ